MLPNRGWSTYREALRALGEYRDDIDPGLLDFPASLGLVADERLTDQGRRYFHLAFIEDDASAPCQLLAELLLQRCPEAAAISQMLANRADAPRSVAETVLRSQGYGAALTPRRLGSLLALMDAVGLISYSKREGTLRVLVKPLSRSEVPRNVFIAPETPWSNRVALRKVLGDCRGHILWLDKHFLPEGLDFLGEAADGARVSSVRVLSLGLDENQTRRARRAYRDLARELVGRGIDFEWRFIESCHLRDTHDRWIIGHDKSWNVPNLNAVLSGQHSEIIASDKTVALQAMFERAWELAPARPAAGSKSQAAEAA